MTEEFNIENKYVDSVESLESYDTKDSVETLESYSPKECVETIDENETDRPNCWYVLPIILNNKDLFDMSKINDITFVDSGDMSLITVFYKDKHKDDIKRLCTDEKCFYNNFESESGINVTYLIPNDERCVCNTVAKHGCFAINKHLFNKYFKKLL